MLPSHPAPSGKKGDICPGSVRSCCPEGGEADSNLWGVVAFASAAAARAASGARRLALPAAAGAARGAWRMAGAVPSGALSRRCGVGRAEAYVREAVARTIAFWRWARRQPEGAAGAGFRFPVVSKARAPERALCVRCGRSQR